MEHEIARLPMQVARIDGDSSPNDLSATFADLVAQLALGAEPELRECPVCKHLGMRAATRCGYCWTTLVPPAARSESAAT
jgi:hypothetical protein